MSPYYESFPELGDFKVPTRMPSDEMAVLEKFLASNREESAAELEMADVADAMLYESLPSMPCPSWDGGKLRVKDVIAALCVGGRDKSPGFPLNHVYQTKGEAFDDALPDLVFAVLVRVLALLIVAPYCTTPDQFYDCFCIDPLSFSIKSEVIGANKLGRPLNCYGYIDAAVEHLWSHTWTAAMKFCKYETHSAIGIGFTKEDQRLLKLAVGDGDHFNSDVPSFDGGVAQNENMRAIRCAVQRMRAMDRVLGVALQHERALAIKSYVMTDGKIYRQLKPGGQVSGRYLTSRLNTEVRARRSYAVDALLFQLGFLIGYLIMCAGDDAIEDPTNGREAAYAFLGYPLREVVVTRDIDFCSHSWGGDLYAHRLHKSLYKLLLGEITKEKLVGFTRSFSNHPRFQETMTALSGLRPEVKEIMSSFQVQYVPHSKKKGGSKSKAGNARKRRSRPQNPIVIQRRSANNGASSEVAHRICSVTNPFCDVARGARFPDGAATKSLGYSTFGVPWTFPTDAGGRGGAMVVPNPLTPFSPYASFAAGVATYSNTLQALSAFPSASRIRITSWGFKITCLQSKMLAAGMVRVRLYSPSNFTALVNVDSATDKCDSAIDVPLSRLIDEDLFVIPAPIGTNARLFVDAATLPATLASCPNIGWQVAAVFVDGAVASTNVIQISFFVNTEYVPLDSAVEYAFARPAMPLLPPVVDNVPGVLEKVGNFVEGTALKVERLFDSAAVRIASRFASAVYGGPPGAALALMPRGSRYRGPIRDVD